MAYVLIVGMLNTGFVVVPGFFQNREECMVAREKSREDNPLLMAFCVPRGH